MPTSLPDAELLALLPDYLNKVLPPESRRAVESLLERSAQARIELDNLKLILEQIPRADSAADPHGLANFLAYAAQRPLQQRAAPRRWWQGWNADAWLRPALAAMVFVIVGQSALIGFLAQKNGAAPGVLTRSLPTGQEAGRERALVLDVHVAPDAALAEVMALIRDVNGRIIPGAGEGTVLSIEVSGMPAQEAIRRLRQSRLVLSVTEAPADRLPVNGRQR